MKCPKCHSDNPDTSSYCADCGTQLGPPKDIPAVTKTIETPFPQFSPGTSLANRYEIIRELGKGGMGEVYLAEDVNLKRQVAIKVLPQQFALDKERLARFEREARLLASLNHPNIATIHGLEKSDGQQFLVMELVEGETLAERINKGPLPVDEALEICRLIADGLESAHEKGIIHRDLKPSNVKISPEGKVKILDFGLAKAFLDQPVVSDLSKSPAITDEMTRPGVILGTAAYMSPEQAKGKAVDKRSDIWAFGCILYECLTGKRAFQGETISETLASILKDETDWAVLPRNTPNQILSLLHRCLQKDPSHRLQHIGDGRIEIQESLTAPIEAVTIQEQAPQIRLFWQRTFPWIITALLGIVAIFALWHLLTKEPTSMLAPTRFVVIPPKEKQLDYYNTSARLTLSPDGMHLVYSCEGILFLRSMEKLETKQLAPGVHPFFSPDGKWVGFFAKKKIKKISLLGGSPQVICNTRGRVQGGSWGTDNTIIFSESGSLWQVTASGGAPEKLIPRKNHSNEEQGNYCWPNHIPGGKAILFTILKSPQDMRIALLNLETRKEKVLIDKGTYAHYVPTGHLVYSWENDILAVQFNIDHFNVTGPSIPVTHDVLAPLWYGQALISVSETGTLAYVPKVTRGTTTLAWVELSGKTERLPLVPAQYGSPRISPDGKRLLFTRLDEKNKIWIYDLERETLRRLMDEKGDEWLPVWTPDGQRVAFNSTRQGIVQGTMYWKSVEGDEPPERIVQDENWPCPHSFSPDGKLLAYRSIGTETSYDIWMLPVDGEKKPWVYLQSQTYETWPKFSPDGKWIAYMSLESGQMEVYVRPSQPSLRRHKQISSNGGAMPLWSPDGRELFYMMEDKIMAVSFQGEPTLKVGKSRIMFEGSFLFISGHDYLGGYDITPDGQRFLIVEGGEPKTITVVLNWFEELKRKVPTRK